MQQAAIAQVVERRIGNAEVTGPTPVSSFLSSETDLFRSFFVCVVLFEIRIGFLGVVCYNKIRKCEEKVLLGRTKS